MAINFPDNPTLLEEYTAPTGRTWIWTGSTWKSKSVNIQEYINDTTDVHGIADTSLLVYQDDIDSLAPLENPTFTGSVVLPATTDIGDVTDTEISYLSGVTSSIQTQIDSKSSTSHTHTLDNVTDVTASATEVNVLDGIEATTIELNYLSGVTSGIQNQIDTHNHELSDIVDVTATPLELNILDGVTITTSELNYLSGSTSNVQDQIDGKASSIHTHNLGDISDISVTTTEVSYLSGVTSGIQSQIDSKASASHTHLLADVTDVTATASEVNILDGVTATTAQINYLNTVSSNVQDQIDSKLSLSGGTMTGKIVLDGDPTQALHATTKEYVDNIASGIISKPATYAATTANLDATYNNGTDGVGATLTANSNGAFPVIDGVQLSTSNGYRGILVKNQTNSAHNGRYNLTTLGDTNTPWVLTKCGLCDTANEIPGSYIFVTDGTLYGGTGWVLYVDDPATFVVGTDPVYAFQFSGSGAYSAGSGLELSGTQFSVDFDTVAPLNSPAFTGTVDMSAATVNGMYLTSDAFENVSISGATNTDVLMYDGTNWINKYVNAIPAKTNQATLSSSNYNIVADDAGKIIEINNSGAATVTIPDNEIFAVGSQIVILQTGSGDAVVSINVQTPASQTINYNPGNKIRGQWAAATLLKRASNVWVLYGDLTA